MGNAEQAEQSLRFQDFEVNPQTGELWKAGIRLNLQDQPFRVLVTLLQRPGHIVSRDELHQLIWPQESFGDFDHAINLAVNKLRSTLGDSAHVPHLIETLPRRGYRFIAPVEVVPRPKQGLVSAAVKHLIPRSGFGSIDGTRKHPWLAASATSILFVAILAGYLLRHSLQARVSFPVTRAVIKLEPGYMLDGNRAKPPFGNGQPTETAVAISSDGHFIVYSAIRENPGSEDKSQLYLRRTDELEAKPIAGTEGGIGPFLSPDDRWVGFWADFKLKKVTLDGASPVTLPVTLSERMCCGTPSWGPNDKIVFAPGTYGRLQLISADGGNPEILTIPNKSKGELSHRLPHWLPDGKAVLFTIMAEWFDNHPRVAVLDLNARSWRVLLEDAADAHYIPTGHLVFLRDGTLMVAPFNLSRREVTGQPFPLVANVMQALNVGETKNTGAGQFSVSDSGGLVYATGGINPDRQDSLVWVDLKGNATPITSFKGWFWAPRLSPDGRQIAYVTVGTNWHAWIYDLRRGTVRQFTQKGKADFPMWTPDGKRVAFKWWNDNEPNLFWQRVDGSAPMERLTTSEYHQVLSSFSPDGTALAFMELRPETGWVSELMDLKSQRVTSILNSKTNQWFLEFSPNGRWMAYSSFDSGRPEVYVRPFPGPGVEYRVSTEAGWEPLWSRDGKQLFYHWQGEYFVSEVRTDGDFSVSKPRLLFRSDKFSAGGIPGPARSWDISLDGQRFLMVKFEERKPQAVTELILVQNWLEELKRLAPSGVK